MKKCGLIGGMSWESTLTYYKIINEEINKKLGYLHSGEIILYSLDFEVIAKLQRENNWEKSGEILANVAKNLENAGADFVLICTNTMHKVADNVKKSINVPLIDIRDVVIEEIKKRDLKKVLLLGTKFTMEDIFYKDYLIKKNIEIIVPSLKERDFIHKVIFNELCLGITKATSKEEFLKIINSYKVDGVILGCTEIGMIVNQDDLNIEILDSTLLHANKAVELMIS